MSLLRNNYDLETHVDEVWYESSNVIYSRFEEDENENKGNLYVVFKGGKQYVYKNVSYTNYLSFKHGGLDGSSGKALNEYIIKVYAAEKLDDVDMEEVRRGLAAEKPEESTYFIHGSGEFSDSVFDNFYAPQLEYAIELYPEWSFITTLYDEYGMRSVRYLLDRGVDAGKIEVWLRKSDADSLDSALSDCKTVKIRDTDYEDDEFIDNQLIKRSSEDICHIDFVSIGKIRDVSRSAYITLARKML